MNIRGDSHLAKALFLFGSSFFFFFFFYTDFCCSFWLLIRRRTSQDGSLADALLAADAATRQKSRLAADESTQRSAEFWEAGGYHSRNWPIRCDVWILTSHQLIKPPFMLCNRTVPPPPVWNSFIKQRKESSTGGQIFQIYMISALLKDTTGLILYPRV